MSSRSFSQTYVREEWRCFLWVTDAVHWGGTGENCRSSLWVRCVRVWPSWILRLMVKKPCTAESGSHHQQPLLASLVLFLFRGPRQLNRWLDAWLCPWCGAVRNERASLRLFHFWLASWLWTSICSGGEGLLLSCRSTCIIVTAFLPERSTFFFTNSTLLYVDVQAAFDSDVFCGHLTQVVQLGG